MIDKGKRLVMCMICAAGFACSAYPLSEVRSELMAERGRITFDSLYTHYSVEGSPLLREHFPFDASYKADYLADDNAKKGNPYSYLWPFSGTLSAAKAMYEATGDTAYLIHLEEVVLPGLQSYYDIKRKPHAYSSYIASSKPSDRFYDDNEWIGIDMAELYMATGKPEYLQIAQIIWEFLESGRDAKLGDGIYWCEQKKRSKNTCSNAPGAVMGLRMFEATNDSSYLNSAKAIYGWTRENLRDSTDGLYFDNMRLNGRVDRRKYAYNSGQMLEAASLLYKITGEESYLQDACEIAENAFLHFMKGDPATDENGEFNLFRRGSIWFDAIMMRGFDEFNRITGETEAMDAFVRNMNYAWDAMRDQSSGLFNEDWTGKEKKERKWLLTQAAMIEMYANASKYLKTNERK